MKASISVASMHDARALATLRTRVAREMTREFGVGHWSPCPCKAEVVRQLRASKVLIASRESEIVGTVRLARALPGLIDSESFTKVDTALYVLGLAVPPRPAGRVSGGTSWKRLRNRRARGPRTRCGWMHTITSPVQARSTSRADSARWGPVPRGKYRSSSTSGSLTSPVDAVR